MDAVPPSDRCFGSHSGVGDASECAPFEPDVFTVSATFLVDGALIKEVHDEPDVLGEELVSHVFVREVSERGDADVTVVVSHNNSVFLVELSRVDACVASERSVV